MEGRDERELHPDVGQRHLAEDPAADGLEPRAAGRFEFRLGSHTEKLSKLHARRPAVGSIPFFGPRGRFGAAPGCPPTDRSSPGRRREGSRPVGRGVSGGPAEPRGPGPRRPSPDALRAFHLTPRSVGQTTAPVFARRLALAATAFACAVTGPGRAAAEVGERLGRLHELRAEALLAHGPASYAAIRRIWLQWDQGDPADVEEALAELAASPSLTPPLRVYAQLLGAYARRRRGDLDGATTRVEALGFVERWMSIGPFDNEGKTGLLMPYGPEEDRQGVPSLLRAYDGKERTVRWRVAPALGAFGWFDFGALIRPTEKVCGYVTTFVHDDRPSGGARGAQGPHGAPAAGRDGRPITIWAGSAGAMRVFWNGEEILRDEGYRDLDADRLATTVKLQPGWNRLMVKVCGDEAAPMLSVRLAGPDGAPDRHLATDPNPVASAEAAAHGETLADALPAGRLPASPPVAPTVAADVEHTRSALPKPPLSVGRVEGPLQAFERLAKSGDAAPLEAYARYLLVTQSDDPSRAQARASSRDKAAEKAPTIPRLLLAGDLAEGRNQRAVWIEKAEALADRGQGDAARTAHRRPARARGTHARRR